MKGGTRKKEAIIATEKESVNIQKLERERRLPGQGR